MRAEMTASFPDVVTVRRFSSASDGQGGVTRTWSDQAEAYARLLPRSGMEGAAEGRLRQETEWTMLTPYGSDITAVDRVKVGVVEYEVIASEDPATERLCVAFELRRVS